MKSNSIKNVTTLFLVFTVGSLAGCSLGIREEMVVPTAVIAKQHPHSVSVEVSYRSDDPGDFSGKNLKSAIERSIIQSKLFSGVVQGKGGDYNLTVSAPHPSTRAVFNVESSMEAGWSLTKASDGSVVMRKSIQSSYTATMSDALGGVARVRAAHEGAVRNNIAQGLQAIADLDL